MLYQEINFSMFCDAWEGTSRKNSFSYDGKRALFDYLSEMDSDSSIALDIVALDCEFSESESAVQWLIDSGYKDKLVELTNDVCTDVDTSDPNLDFEDLEEYDAIEEAALEFLQYNTTVLTFSGGVIVQQF